ncbi:hypothetical protein OF846_000901 [Rhodotorula toruloides]|nr:hypothetical protein OF846_000901 [Rhodotorula toruloides]
MQDTMPRADSDAGSDSSYMASDTGSADSSVSFTQILRVPRPDLVDFLSEDDLPSSAGTLPTPSDILYSRQIPQARLAKSRLIKVLRREPAIGEEGTTGEGLVPSEAADEPEGGEEYQDSGQPLEPSSSSAAAIVAAEAQVAAEEGNGAQEEEIVGASVEGETGGADDGSEPAEGSEQAEEEEADEDDEQPSFGPAVQAVHAITSIAELDRKFEAFRRRSTWFKWDPKVRNNSKTKRQPFIALGDPALMGKNVNSEPTLKIDTLVTIREEAAEGAEKKALKYNKKENLPVRLNEYSKLFGPLCRESARFISAVLQVCANDGEVDELMNNGDFDVYRHDPGETTLFTAIRDHIEKIFDKYKCDYPEPNLVTKLCALLVDGYEQDGIATSQNGQMPRLADPSGGDNKQFAYGAVGVGALVIGIRLLRPFITATSSYVPFKRTVERTITIRVREIGTLSFGLPRTKGNSQRQRFLVSTTKQTPPPPPPTSPPLLTFPHLVTDPPDALGRVRSYAPSLSADDAQRSVNVLGWVNHVLAEMGITALKSKETQDFWKGVLTKLNETPLPIAKRKRVGYVLHSYATRGQTIHRGTLIDPVEGSVRMEGGWSIYDEGLAASAVQVGNEVFAETGDFRLAERRMAALLDVGEGVLDEEQATALVQHPPVNIRANYVECAGCGVEKPLDEFYDPSEGEGYAYSRILCRECGPFAEEGAFSPRYDSVRRSYCGVRAIQRAHAEAYLQFRQLRKILGFEGMDKAKSTPKSLARAYDGKYGFDFHSGMGYDKYSQMPVAIATDEPTTVSLDSVAPLPVSATENFVRHADLRNLVPTLRTTNFAVGSRDRHTAEVIITVARLLPLVHDLNFARTQRKLTASESKALVVATHVLQHARSVNAPMHRDERAFGIFSPIQKVHEVPVSELLASDEPLAEFLGVVKLMDDLWLKFMSPRSASDPLPGSYDFYRLNFEEFRSVPEERVLRYVEKAKRKLHDFRVETPDYVPFPPQSRPTKDFDSEEERQRVRTLLDEIESSDLIRKINPHFEGFTKLEDGSGWPSFVSDIEMDKWEVAMGRKLMLRDLLAEAGVRMLRILQSCDVNFRDDPDADPLDGFFGNVLVELYLEMALGEGEDLMLGQAYLLAPSNPFSAGMGHRIQGQPMKFGAKVARPRSLDEYDLKARNISRRNWQITRQFNVQLQSFPSDNVRKSVIQSYGSAVRAWLEEKRYAGFDHSDQEKLAAALKRFYSSPASDCLRPWKARGLLA